eukprot:TRINITY_DN6000_c0_g1_i1.p1 TRINITY_DN6000_c0_g1~~TRINITY_DN6000_c0_g1_i1.p1  ORF type:complete len:157 (-),score=38.14 TRINITY_DN6000_c0_g1_i1:138-569(-)
MSTKSKWKVDIEPVKSWKDIYPFHAAAQLGDLSALKSEYEKNNGQDLDKLDDDSWSPLHYSSWYGHSEVVDQLLKWKSDPNVKNGNGSTPLHFAAGCGKVEVVKILLKNGAEKNVKDKEKMDPKGLTLQLQPEGYQQIVSLLE